jgi:hypothetical protein
MAKFTRKFFLKTLHGDLDQTAVFERAADAHVAAGRDPKKQLAPVPDATMVFASEDGELLHLQPKTWPEVAALKGLKSITVAL